MNRDIFDEKDMLELFNYIGIDDKEKEDDDTNLKMNDLTKKRLKKNLLKQVKGKGSVKKFKYKAVAVAAVVVISIGLAVPAVAKNIPALKSMIQALNSKNDDNGVYEKYSKMVNKSVTDKGITFTVNEVLCDESTMMIGYTIKSEGDIKKIVRSRKEVNENSKIGDVEFALGNYLKIDGKKPFGGGGDNDRFLDDHTYINSERIDIGNSNLPPVFNVDLDIKNIFEVYGNWSFKFSVSRKEMIKDSKEFKPNVKVKLPDAVVNVEKISFTPLNTYIKITGKYTKKEYEDSAKRNEAFNQHPMAAGPMVYTQWAILDDKGYEIEGGKCIGSTTENSASSDFCSEYTIPSLKNIPKYLTVIPFRDIPNTSGGEGTRLICKDISGVYPIELPQEKMGKLIIKEIKTEKDKTIVRYTAEGEAPFYQAKFLNIIDDKGEDVEEKSKNFIGKRDENNPNGYIKEFAPLDKNKKYKIVTHGLDSHVEIRNDLKFRIDLSNK